MNNWVYLILIAVLAILAVVMLYSRFAARSREKSFHHAPARIVFPSETISVAPTSRPGSLPVSASEEESLCVPETKGDLPGDCEEECSRIEMPKSPESDYLDELQEAAAGLALLMRSSPVGRVAPVVFAPEEHLEKAVLDPVVAPLVDPAADEPALEEIAGPVVESGVPSPEMVEEKEISLRDVLGEKVIEIVDRIDLELEALERLVAGLEAGLVYLGTPDHGELTDAVENEEESRVSEAA